MPRISSLSSCIWCNNLNSHLQTVSIYSTFRNDRHSYPLSDKPLSIPCIPFLHSLQNQTLVVITDRKDSAECVIWLASVITEANLMLVECIHYIVLPSHIQHVVISFSNAL